MFTKIFGDLINFTSENNYIKGVKEISLKLNITGENYNKSSNCIRKKYVSSDKSHPIYFSKSVKKSCSQNFECKRNSEWELNLYLKFRAKKYLKKLNNSLTPQKIAFNVEQYDGKEVQNLKYRLAKGLKPEVCL